MDQDVILLLATVLCRDARAVQGHQILTRILHPADDEDSESDSGSSSAAAPAIRRRQFDDEEDDGDVSGFLRYCYPTFTLT